jgi:hypothetical protein
MSAPGSARLGRRSALTLAFVAAGAAGFARAAQEGRKLTLPPDLRTQLDMQHFYLPRELQVALSALETAYPEFLRLESLGRSATGAELWVMTVARKAGRDPARRPAALIVAGLGAEDLGASELALFTILELVQNHARDDAAARVLDSATVYVVPCANPDLRERVLGALERGEFTPQQLEEPVRIDRNFPVRWDPLGVEACGAFPLARPESRALAEFVLGHPNIALVQRFSSLGARSPLLDPSWPAEDVRAHRRVAAEGLLESVESIAVREGALLSFAYEQTGAFAFSAPTLSRVSGDGPLPALSEILPLARNAASSSLRLISSLPELAIVVGEPQALGASTWQLDVEVRNTGRLPTCSELGAARFACGAPQLEVAGAELAGAALLRASDSVPIPTPVRGGAAALPQIDGGSSARLRLFVSGASGAQLTLTARAARAGEAQAQIALP